MARTKVTTDVLADDVVTSAKIADDAVVAAAIADDAVVTAAIADDAITSALIADNAVVAAAIANDAVTVDKTEYYAIASSAPGSPAAGDLWYDTSNELLKVYREVSSGSYEWQGLATAGGESPTAFTLDGGSF